LLIVPVIVFLINWKLALVAGIGLPCTIFSLSVLSKVVNRSARLVSEKRAELGAKNQEFLSGVREIQALGIEQRVLRRATHINLEFRKLDMTLRTYGNLQSLFGSLTGAAGVLLYTWYGAMQIIGGVMSVGEFTAFTTFVGYLYGPLMSLAGLMVPIQESIVYSNRFYEVYGLLPEVKSPIKPVVIDHFLGNITFSGVSFWYQNDRMALDHIDLDVAPGKKVAIIGKSGSGKSTLMSLIPRFYDVKKGTIRIDGVDIRDLSLKDLRSQISIVMQDPFFFVDTIYNNITGGRPSFTLEQVIEATTAANVHDFILSLPTGYDTVIGEDGVTLSGGEKKRIAMARAFLLDCPILIMDEATSAVDEKTEMAIRQATARLMAGRTTFIVSHRLASVIDSDLIVLMENGRILESGRHEELLALGGGYAQQFLGEKNVTGMSSCLVTV
jgi:subfamily B ATP-binding cassette protein MsbA